MCSKSGAVLDIGARPLKGEQAEGGPSDPSSQSPLHSAAHYTCQGGVLLPTPSLLTSLIELAWPTGGE